jgi:hypothetical protein
LWKSYKETSHDSDAHKNKARHDEALAQRLCENNNFPDWSIVCSFYFALHCVDAYAHKLGIKTFEPGPDEKISAHGKRRRFVRNNLRNLFSSYGKLYSRSEQCRYDPVYYKLISEKLPEKMLEEAKKFLLIR